jgi:hypothetical protein
MYVVLNGGHNFDGGKESFCDLESVTYTVSPCSPYINVI